MRRIGLLTVVLLAMIVSGRALGFGPHALPKASDGIKLTEFEEAEFHYISQYFECQIQLQHNGHRIGSICPLPDRLYVAQVVTVKCTFGYLDTVNLTIPYGKEEIVPSVKVLNTAEKSLDREIHQTENQTTVSIHLPQVLGPGQHLVFILRYWIYDLPGDQGICKPVKTSLLGRLLGGGNRFQVAYRPGIFQEPLDQLVVTVYAPLGYVPKTYEQVSSGHLLEGTYVVPPFIRPHPTVSHDPVTGRMGLIWNLTTDIPRKPEFRAVFGKPSLLESHPVLMTVGIIAPFVVGGLIYVLRKVKYLSPRKLTEDGEE